MFLQLYLNHLRFKTTTDIVEQISLVKWKNFFCCRKTLRIKNLHTTSESPQRKNQPQNEIGFKKIQNLPYTIYIKR